MSDLENIERYADSLYGELQAEKHAHRKDNAYLLSENQRLRDALAAALERLENVDGNLLLTIHDAQVILREVLAGDAKRTCPQCGGVYRVTAEQPHHPICSCEALAG